MKYPRVTVHYATVQTPKLGYSLHDATGILAHWFQRVFPHQIRDVLLKFGHIKEHLAVSPHLQTQVVAGGVYLMGLEAKRREVNGEKDTLSSRN